MNDLIKIYSYPRSGTHWLAYLIYNRFFPDLIGKNKINGQPGVEYHDDTGLSGSSPWMGLVAGHWYHPDCAPNNLDRAIYIIRNPKDAIVSQWNLANSQNEARNLPLITFSDFLRSEQKGNKKNYIPPSTEEYTMSLPVLWHWSAKMWTESGVLIVKYENLLTDFEKELSKIKEAMGLHDDGNLYIDPKKKVGFNPSNQLKKDKWKSVFTKEDLEYFEHCAVIGLKISKEIPKS